MSPSPHVAYELSGPLAVVRLDRPEQLNAFTPAMVGDIRDAVERAEADDRVFAITITGTGRAFSGGLDTTALARSAEGDVPRPASPSTDPDELPALFSHLLRVPKPVIAAVNGVAAGGGFVLAMMCDLRFAAEQAWFTTVFSRRGLIAEHGTSWLLPRLVGLNRALDLLWSSRRVSAEEAWRIGFVDRVVADDELLDAVSAYVDELAATVSPRSIAVMKAQLLQDLSLPLADACRDADERMRLALAHPDAKEGVASFVERRPPRFAPWTGGPA
jgi:enoyl-CoA hydratase/carnithine racemase